MKFVDGDEDELKVPKALVIGSTSTHVKPPIREKPWWKNAYSLMFQNS
jgi:hypothetical protein